MKKIKKRLESRISFQWPVRESNPGLRRERASSWPLDQQAIFNFVQSRRRDSNTRPLRPERSALPNWATPRLDYVRKYNIDLRKCQQLFLIFFYFLHFFYIIYIFYSSSHFQSVTHAWRIKFSKRYLQKSFLFEQNSVIISKRELIASAYLNREVPLL